jgi:hypothetical protein
VVVNGMDSKQNIVLPQPWDRYQGHGTKGSAVFLYQLCGCEGKNALFLVRLSDGQTCLCGVVCWWGQAENCHLYLAPIWIINKENFIVVISLFRKKQNFPFILPWFSAV